MSLIFCACGCGQQREEVDSRGRPCKFIHHHAWNKGTIGLMPIPWNKGIPQTEERKKQHSECMKGKPSPYKGRGANSGSFKLGHGWKGGPKLSDARHTASRKQFGFIPLNDCDVDGWVGHHIDWNYVIYIPEELHKSVYHSVSKNINMDIINDKVYDWFTEYYFKPS